MKSILQLSVSVLAMLGLFACNSNIGSNGTNSIITPTDKVSNLNALPQKLTIAILPHESTTYTTMSNTPIYTMLQVTNNTNTPTSISADPSVDNSSDFSVITDSQYFTQNNRCKKDTPLNNGDSCMVLVKANIVINNSAPQNNATGNLIIKTPTYNYVYSLLRSSLLYIGGNFGYIQTPDESTIISAQNQKGQCIGIKGNSSCLLISYDPNTKEIKEVAEADDEIYGIATDNNGNIIVGGAFTTLAFSGGIQAIEMSSNNTPDSAIFSGNVLAGNANTLAKANQVVYSITKSPSGNGVYFSGAFNQVTDESGNNPVNSTNQACMVSQIDAKGTLSKAVDNINGFINSMTANTYLTNDNITMAGMFSQADSAAFLDNSIGVMNCTGGKCYLGQNLSSGKPNVIANNFDGTLMMSGEYTSLPHEQNIINGDVSINDGTGAWYKLNESGANGAVYSILAFNNSYYLGGNFTSINGTTSAKATYPGDCVINDDLCQLVNIDPKTNVTSVIFLSTSSIDAIANGYTLTVTEKQ